MEAIGMVHALIVALVFAFYCVGQAYAARVVTIHETRLHRAQLAVVKLARTVKAFEVRAAHRVGVAAVLIVVAMVQGCAGYVTAHQPVDQLCIDGTANPDCDPFVGATATSVDGGVIIQTTQGSAFVRLDASKLRYMSDGAFAVPTDDCAVMVYTDNHAGYRVPLSESACLQQTAPQRVWQVRALLDTFDD